MWFSLLACTQVGPEFILWEPPGGPVCNAVVVDTQPVGDGVFTRTIRYEVSGDDASATRGQLYAIAGDTRTPVDAEQEFDPRRPHAFTLTPSEPLAPDTTYEVAIDLCDGITDHEFAFRTNDVGLPVDDLSALDGTHWMLDLDDGEDRADYPVGDHTLVLSVHTTDALELTLSLYDSDDDAWLVESCPYVLSPAWSEPWLTSSDAGPGPLPYYEEGTQASQTLELRCGIGNAPVRIDTCTFSGLVQRFSRNVCDTRPCSTCPWSPDDYEHPCVAYDIAHVRATPTPQPPASLYEEAGCTAP